MTKIIDTFIFNNELELLEARLNLLAPHVDYFVLVECRRTHRNEMKPLQYANNAGRFAKHNSKIVHVVLDEWSNNDEIKNDLTVPDGRDDESWSREYEHRNAIEDGLDSLNITDDDVVFISDVDEFYRPEIIGPVANLLTSVDSLALSQRMYYYNFSWAKTVPWNGTVVTKFSHIRSRGIQYFRSARDVLPRVPNAGFHLSWFGGIDANWTKLQHHVLWHPCLVDAPPTKDEFARRINSGQDVFGRTGIETLERQSTDEIVAYFMSHNVTVPEIWLI